MWSQHLKKKIVPRYVLEQLPGCSAVFTKLRSKNCKSCSPWYHTVVASKNGEIFPFPASCKAFDPLPILVYLFVSDRLDDYYELLTFSCTTVNVQYKCEKLSPKDSIYVLRCVYPDQSCSLTIRDVKPWYGTESDFVAQLIKETRRSIKTIFFKLASLPTTPCSTLISDTSSVYSFPLQVFRFYRDLFAEVVQCTLQRLLRLVRVFVHFSDFERAKSFSYFRFIDTVLSIAYNRLTTRVYRQDFSSGVHSKCVKRKRLNLYVCCVCNLPANLSNVHNRIYASQFFEGVFYCQKCVGNSYFYKVPLVSTNGRTFFTWISVSSVPSLQISACRAHRHCTNAAVVKRGKSLTCSCCKKPPRLPEEWCCKNSDCGGCTDYIERPLVTPVQQTLASTMVFTRSELAFDLNQYCQNVNYALSMMNLFMLEHSNQENLNKYMQREANTTLEIFELFDWNLESPKLMDLIIIYGFRELLRTWQSVDLGKLDAILAKAEKETPEMLEIAINSVEDRDTAVENITTAYKNAHKFRPVRVKQTVRKTPETKQPQKTVKAATKEPKKAAAATAVTSKKQQQQQPPPPKRPAVKTAPENDQQRKRVSFAGDNDSVKPSKMRQQQMDEYFVKKKRSVSPSSVTAVAAPPPTEKKRKLSLASISVIDDEAQESAQDESEEEEEEEEEEESEMEEVEEEAAASDSEEDAVQVISPVPSSSRQKAKPNSTSVSEYFPVGKNEEEEDDQWAAQPQQKAKPVGSATPKEKPAKKKEEEQQIITKKKPPPIPCQKKFSQLSRSQKLLNDLAAEEFGIQPKKPATGGPSKPWKFSESLSDLNK